MELLEPLVIGGRRAPNRVLFGPHETNLGKGRAISDRHLAYYRRRLQGGVGMVVTEEASVHPSDWPYERSPLASHSVDGWAAIAAAAHEQGALAFAALGHAGGQGSSAYHQAPLWAPSRVPEVNSREVPKWMEPEDIAAVVEGFADAAALARQAGMDGVEINAGQYSLIRQFLSGLTNFRDDQWGTDRLAFARQVLDAVSSVSAAPSTTWDASGNAVSSVPAAASRRGDAGVNAVSSVSAAASSTGDAGVYAVSSVSAAASSTGAAGVGRPAVDPGRPAAGLIIGLRLSCDELAPWAGLTPEAGAGVAVALAPLVDYLVVVRGSIFSASATRPDTHVEPGFNVDLCRLVRGQLREAGFDLPVFLQGSVVQVDQAAAALAAGVCDGVEMTRAQIADPDLVLKLRAGHGPRIRPCILCNQTCQVRDARNPIVSCVAEPSAGHETEAPAVDQPASVDSREMVIVGGGPAGLEAARVAAERGHRVTLMEKTGELGGSLRIAATAAGRGRLAALVDWLVDECNRLGVTIRTNTTVVAQDVEQYAAVLLCTGSVDGERGYLVAGGVVCSAADWLAAPPPGDGPVVVHDPIGGPIGVSVAETIAASGRPVHLITQDQIAGNELARTGDLAPANARLQQAGVVIERRGLLRAVRKGEVDVEDRFTGQRRTIAADAVVDAGFRLPDQQLWEASGSRLPRAGDAVAPRTVYEAMLEARRSVLAMEASSRTVPV